VADPLADILEPAYLSGLSDRSLDDVRAMRDRCQQVESGLSYVRRLAHGRLDIVGGELARRRSGGDPADLAPLVARLPELLADSGTAGPRVARSPRRLDLEEPSFELESELDGIVRTDDLIGLTDRSDADLQGLADGLVAFERATSERRRRVQERIDTLQAEIARRYQAGEASIESMLE
jgi:hypothetical protein